MAVLAGRLGEPAQTMAAGVRTPFSPGFDQPASLLIAGPPNLAADLVAAVSPAGRRFAVSAVHPSSPMQLLKALRRHSARIAVLDVELCHVFGMETLRELRRVVPDTTWLAGWAAPTARALDVLIEGRMRGALAWSDPPARVVQALDAVCLGEMWFPRAVMQALYVTASSRSEASVRRPQEEVPAADASLVLTLREREVVELARRGLTNKTIAQQLLICPDTVKKHLASAYEKLHVHRRRQIVL